VKYSKSEVPVKIMKWEVSQEVGSMAYSTNSYLKMSDFYVFWDLKCYVETIPGSTWI
jgi:hypothetical protein